MKIISYTTHLELRLELRTIPVDYPRTIANDPDEIYWDTAENRRIAIKRLLYQGTMRPMMIAYDETEQEIIIITIHPISEGQLSSRVARGRWQKDG